MPAGGIRNSSSTLTDPLIVIFLNITSATSESFIIDSLFQSPSRLSQIAVSVAPISACTTLIFLGLSSSLKDSVNPFNPNFEEQYDDHINCVKSEEELALQANITDVLYSGKKLLSNGMNRFMVIGK